MATTTKSSFDFRMSKKVAELTQVVHMLFTRNHEKEVEAEALKDAYEYEISLVIRDAKERIDKLNEKIELLKQATAQEENGFREQLDAALAQQEAEWSAKLTALDEQLLAEKRECQSARDLLIRAQHDIEQLRAAQSHELSKVQSQLSSSRAEVERLRGQVGALEGSLRGKDGELSQVAALQRANNNMHTECEKLRSDLGTSDKAREQLTARNKQLEVDIKNIRRELSKRLAHSAKGKTPPPPPPPPIPVDYELELEKLRNQIQMYRNELYNRETNFNRMFTDKQPVTVGSGKVAQSNAGTARIQMTQASAEQLSSALRYSREYTQLVPNRHKNLNSRTQQHQQQQHQQQQQQQQQQLQQQQQQQHHDAVWASEDDYVHTPRSSSHSERLPQLGMDQRARLQRLAKPKPIPRELLSAKARTPLTG